MSNIEVMKQALEALDNYVDKPYSRWERHPVNDAEKAILALRAAIEEGEQRRQRVERAKNRISCLPTLDSQHINTPRHLCRETSSSSLSLSSRVADLMHLLCFATIHTPTESDGPQIQKAMQDIKAMLAAAPKFGEKE